MTYQTDFSKTWSAILAIFHKYNVETTAIEKDSGTISGICDREAPVGDVLMGVHYRDKLKVLVSKASPSKTKVSIRVTIEKTQTGGTGDQWTVYNDLRGISRDTQKEMFLYGEISTYIQALPGEDKAEKIERSPPPAKNEIKTAEPSDETKSSKLSLEVIRPGNVRSTPSTSSEIIAKVKRCQWPNELSHYRPIKLSHPSRETNQPLWSFCFSR